MKFLKPLIIIALIGVAVWLGIKWVHNIQAATAVHASIGGVEVKPQTGMKVVLPAGVPSQIRDYGAFKLSFNRETRTPNYVVWELLGSEVGGEAKRHNRFWQDTELEGCPDASAYRGSGYDRGHMAPAADMKWDANAMHSCFSMANMCPQDSRLNAGAWSDLEKLCRNIAMRDSAIIIVSGPLYDEGYARTIGPEYAPVAVPSGFFKVVLSPYHGEPKAIGFLMPNMPAPGALAAYAVSVDEVEQLTGFDFFADLPDDIENSIEARHNPRQWNM